MVDSAPSAFAAIRAGDWLLKLLMIALILVWRRRKNTEKAENAEGSTVRMVRSIPARKRIATP